MKEKIEKAIAAHGAWKTRLEGAITTGKIDVSVDTIKADNQCEFGKWLYGEAAHIDAKHADHFKKVKDLHAQFHQAAGHVAELATTGNVDEAKKIMSGAYAATSSHLIQEMTSWSGHA